MNKIHNQFPKDKSIRDSISFQHKMKMVNTPRSFLYLQEEGTEQNRYVPLSNPQEITETITNSLGVTTKLIRFVYFIESEKYDVLLRKKTLNEDEKTIYTFLKNNIALSSSEIAEGCGFGKTKTVSILKNLVKNGYIKTTGTGRGIKYICD